MTERMSEVSARVARRAVRVLIGMRDDLQSGDDSGLVSVWEELCIQIQDEHSVFWEAYDRTVNEVVRREVEALPPPILRALGNWIDTSGETSFGQRSDLRDNVTDHLQRSVYGMAARWSNRRIRAYLRRH